jgi:hypothetical protein
LNLLPLPPLDATDRVTPNWSWLKYLTVTHHVKGPKTTVQLHKTSPDLRKRHISPFTAIVKVL